MQETRPEDLTHEQAEQQNKLRQEFFNAENQDKLNEKMDKRLKQLEDAGEVLTRRVAIEGSQIPGILESLAKGILGAHNKGQRRRMKSEAVKLIESL